MAAACRPKFHGIKGENIIYTNEKHEAKWFPRRSGGIMFGRSPIKAGKTLNLEVDGSGHIEIGITSRDPQEMTPQIPQSTSEVPSFHALKELRLHKRKGLIVVKRSATGDKIESTYRDIAFHKKVLVNKTYWLVVYVKFGSIKFRFAEIDYTFSSHHGNNISATARYRETATILQNPAAVCFLQQRLLPGSKVAMTCAPILDGTKEPSRYALTLNASFQDPDIVYNTSQALFDVSVPQRPEVPWACAEKLENEDCYTTINGVNITVSLQLGGTVVFSTATGQVKRRKLDRDVSKGIWLVLELYRVRVCLQPDPETLVKIFPDGLNILPSVPDSSLTSPKVVWAPSQPYSMAKGREALNSSRETCSMGKCNGGIEGFQRNMLSPPALVVGKQLNVEPGNRDCARAELSPRQRENENLTFGAVLKSGQGQTTPFVSDLQHQELAEKVQTLEVQVARMQSNQGASRQGVAGKRRVHDNGCQVHVTRHGRVGSGRAASGRFISLDSAIRRNWVPLLRNVIVKPLCDYLFQYQALRDTDIEEITATLKQDKMEARRMLLNCLRQKPPSFELLEKILEESEQCHLKDYFLIPNPE